MKTLDQCFDGVDLTSDCSLRTVPLTQRNGDVFLVIHHAFNYTVGATLDLSKPGGRTVSMTGAMGPWVAADTSIVNILAVPWNTHRPFTTASSIDDKAITFEVSNAGLNPPYPVQGMSKQRLAEVAAAMHVELGMPLDRWHVTSHQEVYERGWGSYPTACPGGDLQAALDWIVEEAKRIVSGAPAPTEEQGDMDMRYLNVVNGGSANIGEFSFEPFSPETHGDWAIPYRITSNKIFNGIDVEEVDFAIAKQSAYNRKAAFLADITAATTGLDPAVLKATVQEAVGAAVEDADLWDEVDVASIVHGVANELGGRLSNG